MRRLFFFLTSIGTPEEKNYRDEGQRTARDRRTEGRDTLEALPRLAESNTKGNHKKPRGRMERQKKEKEPKEHNIKAKETRDKRETSKQTTKGQPATLRSPQKSNS